MSPRNKEKNQQVLAFRREQILSTALKVFARRGLAGTKISDIASAAGLSQGLLYRYFKTKDEIFIELVKRTFELPGIPEYASQLKASPWEKIKSIVEILFSVSFEGDGLYYWNIVNQAYTSEAIPEAVKELIKQKKSSLSDSIIPIIIEGQKLGQIVQGDPLKLYTALYSALNGLTMQIMRSKNMPEYPMSLPDSETIMRLLKNPEYNYELIIPQKFESLFREIKFIHKHLSYRFQDNAEAEFKIINIKILETIEKDIRSYQIESDREAGEIAIVKIRADNMQPLSVELTNPHEDSVSRIDYRDNSVIFDFPKRNIHKEVKLNGDYYDSYSLPYVLQGFPFESNEKITFTVVWAGSDAAPAPLGPYDMDIQKTGREMASVPAGDFDCHKLEMAPVGAGNSFGEMYIFCYWLTADDPHFLVKYEDGMGNLRELATFE